MDQGLELLNEPGAVTWQGCANQRYSVLDLTFLNEAAMVTDQFTGYFSSFTDSIGSDHVVSFLTWYLETSLALIPPPTPVGFAIDDLLQASWISAFCQLSIPPITSIPSLSEAANHLHSDIDLISASLFSPC